MNGKKHVFKVGTSEKTGTQITPNQDEVLSEGEFREFSRFISGMSSSISGDMEIINNINLRIGKLSKAIYEWSILRRVASHLEVEILKLFDEIAPKEKGVLTTGQIARHMKKSKASVSRALSNLCKKGVLKKLEKGVYTNDLGYSP
ncbi:MAG: type IV toxin-antitoxin system AbiEi family antitoxin domain-containing protein [Methanosarcinales archaeon]|nr:MAG: type IV toxin-antitoxin system AbiEi family antitoxin domain-containing protein [Methanosarcinales archaeon]